MTELNNYELEIEKNQFIKKDLVAAFHDCQVIINNFGPLHQASKLFEEITELNNDLMEDKTLMPESADVFVLLLQFYGVDPAFRKEIDTKIKRTFERYINKGVKL